MQVILIFVYWKSYLGTQILKTQFYINTCECKYIMQIKLQVLEIALEKILLLSIFKLIEKMCLIVCKASIINICMSKILSRNTKWNTLYINTCEIKYIKSLTTNFSIIQVAISRHLMLYRI